MQLTCLQCPNDVGRHARLSTAQDVAGDNLEFIIRPGNQSRHTSWLCVSFNVHWIWCAVRKHTFISMKNTDRKVLLTNTVLMSEHGHTQFTLITTRADECVSILTLMLYRFHVCASIRNVQVLKKSDMQTDSNMFESPPSSLLLYVYTSVWVPSSALFPVSQCESALSSAAGFLAVVTEGLLTGAHLIVGVFLWVFTLKYKVSVCDCTHVIQGCIHLIPTVFSSSKNCPDKHLGVLSTRSDKW